MKKHKGFLRILLHIILCTSVPGMGLFAQAKPNIIFILADDLGYADLGCQGSEDIRTPAIDRIASSGIRYTAGYVPAPQCGPSRAGIMSGMNPLRFGYEDNFVQHGLPPETQVPTMAEMMHAAGYVTGIVGKWHLGDEPIDPDKAPWPDAPWRRGFDYTLIHQGGLSYYFPYGKDRERMLNLPTKRDPRLREVKEGTQEVTFPEYPYESYLTDVFSNAGIRFIQRHQHEPFFLYLSYNAPHMPLQARQDDIEKNMHIKDENRRIFAGMMTALDRGIGQILETLQTLGIDRNTVVVFLSDNGAPNPKVPQPNYSRNDPWRGYKGNMLEGGIRIPYMISYPGTIPAGLVDDQPVISLDLFTTFAELVGAEINRKLDYPGISLIPTWEGKKLSRAPLVWRWRTKAAVRSGNLKYIDIWEGQWGIYKDIEVGIYDLETNPQELTERAIQKKSKANKMKKILSRWRKKYENQFTGTTQS